MSECHDTGRMFPRTPISGRMIAAVALCAACALHFGLALADGMPPSLFDRPPHWGCRDSLNATALALQDRGAELLWQKRSTAEGLRLLQRAVALEPHLVPAYLNLAAYYTLGQRDCERAQALMKRAVLACDHEPDLWIAQGNVLAACERHSEAVTSFARARGLVLAQPPVNDSLLASIAYNQGNSLATLGKFEPAIASYEEARRRSRSCGFRKVWHLISGYYGPFAEGAPVRFSPLEVSGTIRRAA